MANVLSTERRAQVVKCLIEGNSIRATVRMTGTAKNTVTKVQIGWWYEPQRRFVPITEPQPRITGSASPVYCEDSNE